MRISLLFVFCSLLFSSFVSAEEELRVAISPFSPFVVDPASGTPKGYSIDLWESIAKKENLKFHYVAKDGVKGKLAALKSGEVDLAIGGVSVTEEREELFDFSHSTYRGGLDILTKESETASYMNALHQLFSERKAILITYFLVIIIGAFIMWAVERGKDNFNDNFFVGYEEAFYFAVTTSTTVGYGDYHPGKRWGRRVAMLMMIVSLPVFGLLNAELTAIITVDSIKSDISGPNDLIGRRVGVIEGTTADQWASGLRLNPIRYKSLQNAAEDVKIGAIDAVVYDQPVLLHYRNTNKGAGLTVVGKLFYEQAIGMAFITDSILVEKINRALLKLQESGELEEIRRKWFDN